MRFGVAGLLAVALAAGCGGDEDEAEPSGDKHTTATLDLSKPPGCWDRAVRGTEGPVTDPVTRTVEEAQDGPHLAGTVVGGRPTEDPIQECKRYWRDGAVKQGVTKPPPLVICVGRNGTPWVVPSNDDNICEKLGLPEPQ